MYSICFSFNENVSANELGRSSDNSQISYEEKLEKKVTIEETKEQGIVVTNGETADVARWDSTWNYTHIAVSTGVLANAINAALYTGIGATISPLVPIPGWAIHGMLQAASWTKLGSKPGEAVAKQWDTNKNGWVGFYFQNGYDARENVVATRYSTR